MAFWSCCLRFLWFAFAWVVTCAAAPLASVDMYFFSHCVYFHGSGSASYLIAPLAFSPDSSGCLGRPLTGWLFSGCSVAFSPPGSF